MIDGSSPVGGSPVIASIVGDVLRMDTHLRRVRGLVSYLVSRHKEGRGEEAMPRGKARKASRTLLSDHDGEPLYIRTTWIAGKSWRNIHHSFPMQPRQGRDLSAGQGGVGYEDSERTS